MKRIFITGTLMSRDNIFLQQTRKLEIWNGIFIKRN